MYMSSQNNIVDLQTKGLNNNNLKNCFQIENDRYTYTFISLKGSVLNSNFIIVILELFIIVILILLIIYVRVFSKARNSLFKEISVCLFITINNIINNIQIQTQVY